MSSHCLVVLSVLVYSLLYVLCCLQLYLYVICYLFGLIERVNESVII